METGAGGVGRRGGGGMTLPDFLSSSRIAAAGLMCVSAFCRSRPLFLVLFAASLASDSVDGFLARRLHETSERGARLDSIGDLAVILALVPGVYLLWPEIIEREAVWIVVGLASYLVPSLIGAVRFRRMTSYHTWGAKAMAVFMGVSLLLMFAGISSVPFRCCIPLAVLEGAEEVAITFVLPAWHSNVHTVWHALKIRRSARK
ncbi:MAG: CDP-alcohol phosphatidyltransferase family protein [Lentisphaerae bacterium]|nr:CDP-alcohol phosphatidyltransferase family protein [Lentisphaerota bacterium]